MQKGGPPNKELAQKVFPVARAINIAYLVGRFFYFLACLKWPRLVKFSLYYESLQNVIGCLMPTEINEPQDVTLTTVGIYLNFVLCYFDFVPSVVCVNLGLIPVFVKRAVFFDEPIEDKLFGFCMIAVY